MHDIRVVDGAAHSRLVHVIVIVGFVLKGRCAGINVVAQLSSSELPANDARSAVQPTLDLAFKKER